MTEADDLIQIETPELSAQPNPDPQPPMAGRVINIYQLTQGEYQELSQHLAAERQAVDAEEAKIIADQDLKREAAQRHIYQEEILAAQAADNSKNETHFTEKLAALEAKKNQDAEDLDRIRTRRLEIDSERQKIAKGIWDRHSVVLQKEVRRRISELVDDIESLRNQIKRFCDERGVILSTWALDRITRVAYVGEDKFLRSRMDKFL
jgi:hypothetical protein